MLRSSRRPHRRASHLTRFAVAGALAALASISALPSAAHAQGARSPIDDLIARVRADVNDLKYADAIRRGREVFNFATSMRPEQMMSLRGVMAAAFYPEEREAQQPDSALRQLVEIVRLKPDAELPVEIRWSGLDSLLAVAKARTFAVALRATPAADTLVGSDGRGSVSVISSRPARYRLRIRALPSGAPVMHDSTTTASTTGTLTFRGHDGRTALLTSGQYEFMITAIDPANGDTVTIRRQAEATGTAPAMVTPPPLDTTKLLPDVAKPPRVKMVLTSVAFATATFVMASSARADEPIKSAYSTDGRATFVGIAMLGAAVGGFWLDRGEVSVENLQANMALRATHRKALEEAEAENKRRIAAYRVIVRLQPAGAR